MANPILKSRAWLSQISGALFALACAAAVGVHVVINKFVIADVDVFFAIPILVGFALLFSTVPILLRKSERESLFATKAWPAVGYVFLHSVLASGGIVAGWSGLLYLNPTVASFLGRLEVVFSMLCAVLFLGEVLDLKKILGMVLGIIGVFILAIAKSDVRIDVHSIGSSKGIYLILLSAVCYGTCELFTVLGFRYIKTTTFVFYRSLFNFLLLTVFAMIIGAKTTIDSSHILFLALSAFLGPYLGRVLFMHSLERIPLSVSIGINQSQPLFAAIFSAFFVFALPSSLEWFGGAVILCGCFFLIRKNKAPIKS